MEEIFNDNLHTSKKLSEREWLEIFPEGREILIDKLKDLEAEADRLNRIIEKELKNVKKLPADDQWFLEFQIKVFYVWDLVEVEEKISQLKRDLGIEQFNIDKQWQKKVEYAESVLIQDVTTKKDVKLKKIGRALVGLCPLHSEKGPSFYIYYQSNRFKCYGCGRGGNVINFVMLLYKFSFKGAVEFLNYSF